MPYYREGRCVKKEGGATVKCHETSEKAEAHLRALQANVEDAKILPVRLELKVHSQGFAGAVFLLDFGYHEGISAIQTLARHLMGETEQMVRWVPPHSFHITLVSSSLIDEDQVQQVFAALPSEISAIPVVLGPIDVFEQSDKIVLILRVQASDALVNLQKNIFDAVAAAGAPIDGFSQPDAWQPHITLAYAHPNVQIPKFDQIITATPRGLLVTRSDYYIAGGWTVLEPENTPSSASMTSPEQSPTLKLIKAIFKKINHQQPLLIDDSGFKVQGNRWFAWYTNNWYDLEQEVFPVKAIDFFIHRVKTGELNYPALWFSHLKSMSHGQTDHLIRVGNMVFAAGSFNDSVLAHRMKAYYRAAQKRGVRFRVSHGFKYATRFKIRGAYYLFETYEISPIPEVGSFRAANPYTTWEVKTMHIPEELRREIAAALSDDGRTVNDTTLKRADTVIAEAKSEMEKATGEGRNQKTIITPDDVAARVDALETSVADALSKFQKAFDEKMGKALAAFETGVKTNLDTAKAFEGIEQKLGAFDTRLKAIEEWQKQQGLLAPPPTRSTQNQVLPDSPLAAYMAAMESKHDQSGLSLVEMVTGEKSAEINAAAGANTTGGR